LYILDSSFSVVGVLRVRHDGETLNFNLSLEGYAEHHVRVQMKV